MQEKGQELLAEKLAKNVGFGIGLEFRESSCLLNAKNATLVKAGMAFNVTVGTNLSCSTSFAFRSKTQGSISCLTVAHVICHLIAFLKAFVNL